MIQQNLQLSGYALRLIPFLPTACRQVPAVTPVKSNLSKIINLDKHPASHTYTADSNRFYAARHTAAQSMC